MRLKPPMKPHETGLNLPICLLPAIYTTRVCAACTPPGYVPHVHHPGMGLGYTPPGYGARLYTTRVCVGCTTTTRVCVGCTATTRVWEGCTPPWYVPPYTPWVYHHPPAHPAHARCYTLVRAVTRREALGSDPRLIRREGASAQRGASSLLRKVTVLRAELFRLSG